MPQKREPDRGSAADKQLAFEKVGVDGLLLHLTRLLARHERDAAALNKTMRHNTFRRRKRSKH
jgi:hypothetical protein